MNESSFQPLRFRKFAKSILKRSNCRTLICMSFNWEQLLCSSKHTMVVQPGGKLLYSKLSTLWTIAFHCSSWPTYILRNTDALSLMFWFNNFPTKGLTIASLDRNDKTVNRNLTAFCFSCGNIIYPQHISRKAMINANFSLFGTFYKLALFSFKARLNQFTLLWFIHSVASHIGILRECFFYWRNTEQGIFPQCKKISNSGSVGRVIFEMRLSKRGF